MICVGGWSRTWPLDGRGRQNLGRIGSRLDQEVQNVWAGAPAKLGAAGLIGIENAGTAGHLALDRRGRIGAVGDGEVVIPGGQAGAQGRVGEQGDRPVGALGGVERVVIAREKDELAVARIELVQADAGVQGRADPAREDLGEHRVPAGPGDLEMVEVHLVGGVELRLGVGWVGRQVGVERWVVADGASHLNEAGACHVAQVASRRRRVIRAGRAGDAVDAVDLEREDLVVARRVRGIFAQGKAVGIGKHGLARARIAGELDHIIPRRQRCQGKELELVGRGGEIDRGQCDRNGGAGVKHRVRAGKKLHVLSWLDRIGIERTAHVEADRQGRAVKDRAVRGIGRKDRRTVAGEPQAGRLDRQLIAAGRTVVPAAGDHGREVEVARTADGDEVIARPKVLSIIGVAVRRVCLDLRQQAVAIEIVGVGEIIGDRC